MSKHKQTTTDSRAAVSKKTSVEHENQKEESVPAEASSTLSSGRFLPRWKPWQPIPTDRPFVADIRTFDIPETIAAAIRNSEPNCVAVTLRPYGGARMVELAERAARRKGIRILWVPLRRGAGMALRS